MLKKVVKLIGLDAELANSLLGVQAGSAHQAASCLLAEVAGFPLGPRRGTAIEYGRRFLDTNGSSCYIDSDHFEVCLSEHTRALDYPALLYGGLVRLAQQAMQSAQQKLPAGTRLNVLANCSDGRTAWGSHLNVLVTRECFENTLYRKPLLASFLATHQVTSIPFTGQGMVGAGNGRSACGYQLSQRADWISRLTGEQTMFNRPLINLRDESHADNDLARLHLIFFDMVLAPVSNQLKVGTTQLITAMIEQDWADPTLCLDDPVEAASRISRDLRLSQTLRTTIRGQSMTAIEIQLALANRAGQFVAEGCAEGIVPDAEEIVRLWIETLDLLQHREVEALARRCDAWLKYLLLDRQRGSRNLRWTSDALRIADSLFASLDPQLSLFLQAADSGLVEQMPDQSAIDHYASQPPSDSRAYFRAHLLRRYGDSVQSMDWSRMSFRIAQSMYWQSQAEIPMLDPRRFDRRESESLLTRYTTLQALVEAANEIGMQRYQTAST